MKLALLTAAAMAALTTGVLAADLPAPAAAVPEAAAPSTDWTGAYLGANVGYGFSGVFTEDPNAAPGDTIDYSGLFVGGQVGYNFALADGVVFGIQADIDWSNESGNDDFGGGISDNFKIDWSGSATAHLGLVAGNFLPYILGGVAFAHGTESFVDGPDSSNTSATHVGWTAGIGAETKVSDNLSAFLEGRYTDYGTANYNGSVNGLKSAFGNFNASAADWSIRAGLNWHINYAARSIFDLAS